MSDVEYACCFRCGKALPKAILRPFKGRRPGVRLYCPECSEALVAELEAQKGMQEARNLTKI